MIFDVHVHLVGTDLKSQGNFFSPKLLGAFRRYLTQLGISAVAFDTPRRLDVEIADRTARLIHSSMLDRAVVLALDGVYDKEHNYLPHLTRLKVSNDFAATLSLKSEKILFGASIHPYRRDAIPELERAVKLNAALVKWLPSAQGIALDDAACFEFYEALAHYRLPLLCHLGAEHMLPTFRNALNNPLTLLPALKRGVTVIGAHCGARMFLHDRSYFKEWQRLALEHENFFGDLSSFAIPTRAGALRRIRRSQALLRKVVYGSDFPAAALPFSFFGSLSFREICALNRLKNPLDKGLETFRRLDLPEEIFSRAGGILRIPAERRAEVYAC